MSTDIRRTVEAVWRVEAAKVTATLAHYVRDVGLGEELAQDALVAALQQWPSQGVPRNPGAWLTTIGKRRAVDLIRRRETWSRKVAELGRELELGGEGFVEEVAEDSDDDTIDDDVLRLIFTACHPVLSTEGRVALTLRMVGGPSTPEIARAFLISEATAAQRIVRAKKTLAAARPAFETPVGEERSRRLGDVLEVVYLIFNEGYAATSGEHWVRADVCEEALRLGRVLRELMPDEPEVHGLAALMEIHSSRNRARIGPSGKPILLLDQDRTRLAIDRGLAALAAARPDGEPGIYVLQAQLAACHASAAKAEDTDWHRIAELYVTLYRRTESPIVQLNHAVAVGMAEGPAVGLALTEPLLADKAMRAYHWLPSMRADFLQRLGRLAEAEAEYRSAATLTANARERALLAARAAECRVAAHDDHHAH